MSFTSDLSVNEFAVAAEAGLRPLRLVGGAGVFRLPPPRLWSGGFVPPGHTMVLPDAAEGWNHARATVLGRLRDEARSCGAQVVTGVDVRWEVPEHVPGTSYRDWYQVFTATGTAMAGLAGAAAADGPVLTNLRVPDFCKLAGRGSVPVGLVTATAIAGGRSAWDYDVNPQPGSPAYQYAVDHPPDYSEKSRILKDRDEYHVLMRKAYSAALEKLRADAAPLGATGITAIQIERTRSGTVVFVHAAGTAIAPAPAPSSPGARERRSPLTVTPVRHLNARDGQRVH